MDRFQGFQRRLQAIFSLHRRKAVATWCMKGYSNAKTLVKAFMHTIGVGYNYVAYKVATDDSARMVLASLLLVTFSLVLSSIVKRRHSKQTQTNRQQQQKEKLAGKRSDTTTPVTPFKAIPKVRMIRLLHSIGTSLLNHFYRCRRL